MWSSLFFWRRRIQRSRWRLDALHVGGHALVALAAHAFRPRDGGADADLVLPPGDTFERWSTNTNVVPGAVGAAHHSDRAFQLDAGFRSAIALSFQALDLAEEDVGQHRPVSFSSPGTTASRLVTGTTPPMIAGNCTRPSLARSSALSGMSEAHRSPPSSTGSA